MCHRNLPLKVNVPLPKVGESLTVAVFQSMKVLKMGARWDGNSGTRCSKLAAVLL